MIILFQPHIKTGCAEIWVEPYKEIMKKDGTDADSMSYSDGQPSDNFPTAVNKIMYKNISFI